MSKFCAIDINNIIAFGDEIQFDLYIKLSETKTIKLEHAGLQAVETLKKYQEKGLEDVYVEKEQYLLFLKKQKEKNKDKFFSPQSKASPEDIVTALDKSYLLTKKAIANIGINEATIDLAQDVHKESLKMLAKTPNVFKFFTKFKKNAGAEFLKNMMTSYTFSAIIGTFDWGSDTLKEKTSLATMLCDILLTEDEIVLAKNRSNKSKDDLPEKILHHPAKTVKLISKGQNDHLVSRETILIIEQHHERPDGSGYPIGIQHHAINILSACHIVADHFIDLCYENKFQEEHLENILDILEQNYHVGNFKKVMKALNSLID